MKSITVQYISVYLPHKRSRKIKNYLYLTKMYPSSKDIFISSTIVDFYSTRPNLIMNLLLITKLIK
uniref:Uncharacterized protein n=1 Tax=Amphimedon queenslandica TaxID=400682 RepID=A0A1X7TCT6_AMPQE